MSGGLTSGEPARLTEPMLDPLFHEPEYHALIYFEVLYEGDTSGLMWQVPR